MNKEIESSLDTFFVRGRKAIVFVLLFLVVGQIYLLFARSTVETPSLILCVSIAITAVALVWFDTWSENRSAYMMLDEFFAYTTSTLEDLNTRMESFSKIYHQCITNEKYLDDRCRELMDQLEKLQQAQQNQNRHHLEQLLLLEKVFRVSNSDLPNDQANGVDGDTGRFDDLQKITSEIEGLYAALAGNGKKVKVTSI